MRRWIEHAHRHLLPQGRAGGDAVRTFQTEERFFVVQVSGPPAALAAEELAKAAAALLERGEEPEAVAARLLAAMPSGTHLPWSLLLVQEGREAHLVECDAPPLFYTRRGHLVLLPVVEEEVAGHLLRRCRFSLEAGDHLAVVSEGYIQARGWSRRWGWRDIATALQRLTATGGGAEELAGALVRMYQRLAGEEAGQQEVSVTALHVRPLRLLTLWSGPPADSARDREALERFLAEEGRRVICGDTTAEIAARLLDRPLELEPRPADGWADVPPTSRLEGVDLVTEGVVTLRKTRERLAAARDARDLPRSEDGATRLARLLLEADVVHFLVGRAVNPAQQSDGVSWRQTAVEPVVHELKRRNKVVSVEYL